MATLNLNLNVPDDKAQEILDAFANQKGYDPASGLSKAQFMKREVIEFIREAYIAELREVDERAARVGAQVKGNNVPIT